MDGPGGHHPESGNPITKELKELDSKKSNNPIKKWGTELNKELSTENY